MIRWLAIVFLLANAAVFSWLYQQDVQQRTRAAMAHEPLPSDTPSLTLLGELDAYPPRKAGAERQGETTPSEDSSEVLAHVAAADRCISAGPFAAAEARDRFREWLRDYVAQIDTRTESTRERRFFWVYLEPTSDEEARASMDALERRGVTDTMLIRRGDLKNAISLGLFRSQDSVNRRLAEMSEKGFKPVVVPQFETSEKFWIDARLAEEYGEALDIPASLLEDGARAETVDCAQLAGTAGD
ncbi:MAG: hypothetical protein RKL32_24575 [Gammaproteobacteria bacterium]